MSLWGLASPATSAENYEEDDVVSGKEDEYSELGLCVPQDRLEDIDFSPNLDDDWIRLDILFPDQDSPKDSRDQESESAEVGHEYRNLSLYVEREDKRILLAKKPRTKTLTMKKEKEMVRKGGRKRNWEGFKGMKRCSHCEAEDTPLWRMGPSGPKTLCNACGLRYKVGRLLENYRPTSSPSFDIAKHSNYYKRIMRQNCLDLI